MVIEGVEQLGLSDRVIARLAQPFQLGGEVARVDLEVELAHGARRRYPVVGEDRDADACL